ncbi:MAG TPA: hypothetical protein IAC31_05940 [Candidatus Faecousia intestinigallinarum]|nr:hypothetical protein [Candidatus Faecousia intestinigallinarum]
MNVKKQTQVTGSGTPTAAQMEAINAQARRQLTPEEVYVFSVRLCDDQMDRDFERFDTAALPELARMFVGKTGVLDHQWSANAQMARIFETQVAREAGVSYIKAWAYIRRGGAGDEMIADIEAGIKKEVSVGCAMAGRVCSICGAEYGACGHQKGEAYDGAVCCAILREPVDAYEFSFVAVPAQREAGVLKTKAAGRSLQELADSFGAQAEYRALYQMAQLGRQYQKQLEDETVRLCLALELGMEEPVLRGFLSKASAQELQALKKGLEGKLGARMPLKRQLLSPRPGEAKLESGYLI